MFSKTTLLVVLAYYVIWGIAFFFFTYGDFMKNDLEGLYVAFFAAPIILFIAGIIVTAILTHSFKSVIGFALLTAGVYILFFFIGYLIR
jgi:succinate dehydrogenase hydrophobic anchor subunit